MVVYECWCLRPTRSPHQGIWLGEHGVRAEEGGYGRFPENPVKLASDTGMRLGVMRPITSS